MVPGEYSITIYTGYQFQLTLVLKDANDTALDLTGATAYAEVRPRGSTDTDPVLDLSPTSSGDATGTITIDVADESTEGLAEGVYQWDLMMDFGDGKRLGPYVVGKAVIREGITKPD